MAHDGRIKVTVNDDTYAIDIPTMRDLSSRAYINYIEGEMFFIDHHDVLRSSFSEYPLAVTKEQYEALISYLQEAKRRFDS